MSTPMTLANFRKLTLRDFENGAVTAEIEAALKERERLLQGRWAGKCIRCGNKIRLMKVCPIHGEMPSDELADS